jgi:hypothetical protein
MSELKRCCPDMPPVGSSEWEKGTGGFLFCPYCEHAWSEDDLKEIADAHVTVKVSEGGQ